MERLFIFAFATVTFAIAQDWTKLNCPAPRSPTNGINIIFDDGKRVEYRCHPGFVIQGRHISYCVNNRWTSPPPLCVRPNSVRYNQRYSNYGSINNNFKTTRLPVSYDYNVAYDRTCLRNTAAGPNLIKAPSISNALIKNYNTVRNSTNPYAYYLEVVYDCKMGYTLAEKDSNKLFCHRGTWVGKSPRCTKAANRTISCRNNNGGCHHICTFVQGTISCSCRNGYELAADGKACKRYEPWKEKFNIQGDDSREKDNPCEVNNGGCAHQCKNDNGIAICACFRGFKSDDNGKTCKDINECLVNNGGCEVQCHNHIGYHVCRCPAGYKIAADSRSCHDINECLRNNNHGPCDDQCKNTKGGYICSCSIPGTVLAPDNHTCQDIDECAKDNFGCSHNCKNTYGNAFCICPPGYELADDDKTCIDYNECEIEVISRYCHGQCINTVGSYVCQTAEQVERTTVEPFIACHSGYQLNEEGRCEDIDECKNNQLGCFHKCVNIPGSAYCECKPGYNLHSNRRDCEDIDECEREEIHRCHHKCVNTIGSFHCTCIPGYVLLSNGTCDGCRKNFYRSGESEVCVECPPNSYTDGIGKGSLADCLCELGFYGNPENNTPCLDIDECKIHNGGCSNACTNTPGSFHCLCPDGYKLDEDEKTCIDVDECSLSKGGCLQGCVNTVGSFHCTCAEGFVKSESNYFSCTDVNECLKDNGECSHKCVNYEGGYYCACKNGYRLASDFRSCLEVTCAQMISPHHGKFSCNSPDISGEYPVNTTCHVKCRSGYVLEEDSTELKCGSDGQWIGKISSCTSLFCPALQKPQNGDVHPPSCLNEFVNTVSQKCYFTCNKGYRLVGQAFVRCAKNLEWNVKKPTVCENNELEPFIKCPADIVVTLEPHQKQHHVRIPEPKSNMEAKHIKIYPKTLEQLEGDFPAGITQIFFTAHHPSKDITASCKTTVNVLDKEAPTVKGCPGTISVYAESLEPVPVSWIEPVFKDNVKVESVTKSQKSGDKFGIGEHLVHYTAKDPSGGVAMCIFTVKVQRRECGEPRDFLHGEKNCMDLLTSRLCEPICDPGYTFFLSNVSEFYICGMDGNWKPSEDIPDCSPYVSEPEGGCLPGTEFREEIDTGTRICVACLPGMYWENEASSCLPCPHGTYQDEFGQVSCKLCTGEENALEEACKGQLEGVLITHQNSSLENDF